MIQKTDGIVYPGSDEVPMGPARDGAVWVRHEKCATCIFHPGNLMQLRPGTVGRMKQAADQRGTCIVCHEGMGTPDAAICRGYYDNHDSALLQTAERLEVIQFTECPAPHSQP